MSEKKKDTKFCMACGAKISADSKFCDKCGDDTENSRVNKPQIQEQPVQKKKLPTWAIVLIVIGCILVIGSLGSSDTDVEEGGSSTKTEEKQESTTKKEEKIEYIKVTKDELDDALEANAANAKDTYKGKYVEISGKLSVIDSDLKYISVTSSTDEWDFLGVHCNIKNKTQKDVVKTLSKDQDIIVRGKITDVGEVLGYYLDITDIFAE